MKGGSNVLVGSKFSVNSKGYTITETLIYLAVTGALFLMAAMFVNGQQRKTEFSQGVSDFESAMMDIANDVSSGFYSRRGNFSCTSSPSGGDVTLSTGGTVEEGANSGCIFLGNVVQFAPGGAEDQYNVYAVTGKKRVQDIVLGQPREVETIAEARPQAIARGTNVNSSGPDVTRIEKIAGGVTIKRVAYSSGATPVEASALGFFSTLGDTSSTGLLQPGRTIVNNYVLGTTTATSAGDLVDLINLGVGTWSTTGTTNPESGLRICLQSGGTKQYAVLTMGGGGREFTSNVSYKSGTCPAAPAAF